MAHNIPLLRARSEKAQMSVFPQAVLEMGMGLIRHVLEMGRTEWSEDSNMHVFFSR